jgi:hypothetical protein
MYIYTISSASLSEYPNNSLTSFTNCLKHELNTPLNETWGISVNYISLHAQFSSDYNVKIIHIECTNIKDSISTEGKSRILATFSYNVNEGGICNYEFRDHIYHELDSTNVKYLSIKILDDTGKQLKLERGQPTIIKLHFARMEEEQYIIHCNSKPSDVNPENTAQHFTYSLPYPISLQGEWEVAISSVSYPTQQLTVLLEKDETISWISLHSPVHDYHVHTFRKGYYSLQELQTKFNHALWKTISYKINLHEDLPSTLYIAHPVTLAFSEGLRKALNINNDLIGREDMMRDQLDMYNGILNMETYKKKYETYLAAYGSMEITPEAQSRFRKMDTMFLYANFIEPSNLGDISAPILKIITIRDNTGNLLVTDTFSDREFHKLTNSQLSSLTFVSRNISGNYIYFKRFHEMYLTLTIRKIK